jgi:hypothetical protein
MRHLRPGLVVRRDDHEPDLRARNHDGSLRSVTCVRGITTAHLRFSEPVPNRTELVAPGVEASIADTGQLTVVC